MDLGVYPLAWVRRIAGEAFEVKLSEAKLRGDVDARFTAMLDFQDGIVAEISSSMLETAFHARLLVSGDEGEIEVINPVAPQIDIRLLQRRVD